MSATFDVKPPGPSQAYVYGNTPPLTVEFMEPSPAPKHEMSSDVEEATNLDGCVIPTLPSISQPLASITRTE